MKLLSFLLLSILPIIASAQEPLSPCFANPSDPSCVDFIYPEDLAKADMELLCKAMPYMSGCSIRDACPNPSLDPFCHTVSTLADVCIADTGMSGMNGCINYKALCKEGSVVAQCKKEVYLPGIPTTRRAFDQGRNICEEMNMDGCETCDLTKVFPTTVKNPWPPKECDILMTYSRLCMAMPTMRQCGEWENMCLTIPDSPYCDTDASSNNPPAMKMYFHSGITDYILFEFWVPRSPLQYASSCLAVFMLGFLLEGIKIGGLHLEHRWILADALRHTQKVPYSLNILFLQDVPRVIVTFFSQSLSYMVMLITMTYNYGIFAFTVFGIAVGAGVLRRYLPRPKGNMEQITCQEDCC